MVGNMPPGFGVDGWTARPDLNTFTRNGTVVRVEPKVMELFVRLAEAPGTVVSKQELFDSIWPGVVVGDDSLTRTVSELRKALGDDARHPRIIETIPKRGYRLIGPTSSSAGTEPLARDGRPSDASAILVPGHGAHGSSRGLASAALLVLMFGVVALTRPWMPAEAVEPTLVLVGPFENTTGQPELGDRVVALIEEEVTRRDRVAVVPADRVSEVLARMRRPAAPVTDLATAREVLVRDGGIRALATGRITQVGGDIGVMLELTSPEGELITSLAVRGADEAGLRTALRRQAAFDLPARVGEQQAARLPAVTTSSLPALELFAQVVEARDRVGAAGGTEIPGFARRWSSIPSLSWPRPGW